MYYAYGSKAPYNTHNEQLDTCIKLVGKYLMKLNLIMGEWLQSDHPFKPIAAKNYNKSCLEPLMLHIAVYGDLKNGLSDPITMFLLVNCLTHHDFSWICTKMHGRCNIPEDDREQADCIQNFKKYVGELVTILTTVQRLHRVDAALYRVPTTHSV
jgi:hypothetical protein